MVFDRTDLAKLNLAIVTVNDLAENLNTGNQTDVILLDFSKAFDKVPHNRLCHKLHHLGINGTLLT